MKFEMLRIVLCLLSLVRVTTNLHCQSSEVLSHLTTADGLAGQRIHQAIKDSRGYMWFATSNGLSRYHGHGFKNYRHDEKDTTSLASNMIYGVFEDSDSLLWVGTASGLDLFDRETETVTHFKNDPADSTSLSDNRVWKIVEDEQENLWVSTFAGLNLFNKKTLQFESFLLFTPDQLENKQDLSNFLGEYKADLENENIVWLTNPLNGIVKFDRRTKKLSRVPFPDGIFHTSSHETYLNRKDEVWVGTWPNGLAKYQPSNQLWKFYYHSPDKKEEGQKNGAHNIVLDIVKKSQEEFWLATTDRGIVSFNWKEESFTYHEPGGVHIEDLFLDENNSLWILSDRGVYLRQGSNTAFSRIEIIKNKVKYLPNSICRDRNGNLIVSAFELPGIYKFNRQNQFEKSYTVKKYKNQKPSIYDFFTAADTIMGISGGNQKLYYLNHGSDFFEPYCPDLFEKPNITGSIIDVHVDNFNNFWIFTHRQGILKLPASRDTIITYLSDDGNYQQIQKETILRDMIVDRHGMLWIASADQGVYVFDPHQGKSIRRYHVNGEKQYKIKDNFTQALLEDDFGNIWIGYEREGIEVINPNPTSGDHLQSIKTQDGLPSENVLTLLKDHDGNIWILTSSGLCRFLKKSKTLQNINLRYGIDHRYSTYENRLLDLGFGELAYITKAGSNLFHIDSLKVLENPPPLVFTNFRVQNTDKNFQKSIDCLNGINLNHDENFFSIHFAALSFIQADLNQYAYQLAGFDKEWIDIGNQSFANYTNVPPGQYTFHLKAANCDGIWNEEGIALDIIIYAPWYWNTWSQILYLTLGAVIIWGLYHFQFRQKLALAEASRLKELDEVKTRFYTNITHEFRTPLSIIKGMADGLTGNQVAKGLILKNAEKLLKLIIQLLDLVKLDAGSMSVNLRQANIIQYTKYITGSLQTLAMERKIHLSFHSKEEEIFMDFDSEKVEHILTNLLSNAFKFTPEYGNIKVEAIRQNGWFVLSVTDSGIGIRETDLPFIFDRFHQVDDSSTRKAEGTGIGLALVKELVSLLEGRIEVKSKLGKGATFTMWLPIKNQATKQTLSAQPDLARENVRDEVISFLPVSNNNGALPKLLIIEDNYDIIIYLETILSEHYHLIIARNGEEGMQKAIETIPDIILCDVMMPEKDGYEVTKTLKSDRITSHIPIILLTAKGDQQSKEKGLQVGADAYLIKPFAQRELFILLQQLRLLREQLKLKYQHYRSESASEEEIAQDQELQFLQQFDQIIKDHLQDADLQVYPHLCQLMTMSKSQLYRKVTSLTGLSPARYLQKTRLESAQNLLRTTGQPISQIAQQVGIADPSYFTRIYVNQYGETPSDTRKKLIISD